MCKPHIIALRYCFRDIVLHSLKARVKHREESCSFDPFEDDTAGAVNVGEVPTTISGMVSVCVLNVKRDRERWLFTFEESENVSQFTLCLRFSAGVGVEVCSPRQACRFTFPDVFFPVGIVLFSDVVTESAADHSEVISCAFDFLETDFSVV